LYAKQNRSRQSNFPKDYYKDNSDSGIYHDFSKMNLSTQRSPGQISFGIGRGDCKPVYVDYILTEGKKRGNNPGPGTYRQPGIIGKN
jgi:hypothetical protein